VHGYTKEAHFFRFGKSISDWAEIKGEFFSDETKTSHVTNTSKKEKKKKFFQSSTG
jgi:hypothetical protein